MYIHSPQPPTHKHRHQLNTLLNTTLPLHPTSFRNITKLVKFERYTSSESRYRSTTHSPPPVSTPRGVLVTLDTEPPSPRALEGGGEGEPGVANGGLHENGMWVLSGWCGCGVGGTGTVVYCSLCLCGLYPHMHTRMLPSLFFSDAHPPTLTHPPTPSFTLPPPKVKP